MVQLKAQMAMDAIGVKNISIPYGSIKSTNPTLVVWLASHFNSLWFN